MDICYAIIGDQMGNILQRDPEKTFAIYPNMLIELGMRLIQTFVNRNTYLERSVEAYQTLRTMLLRKGIPIHLRRYFEKCMAPYLENGFSEKTYRNPPSDLLLGVKLAPRGGRDGFQHFDGLQAYVEEHTRVEALSFDKLDYLFRIYLALLAAIMFMNTVHCFLEAFDVNINQSIRSFLNRIPAFLTKLAFFLRKLCRFFSLQVFGLVAFLKFPISFLFASLNRINPEA